jgi:hypothetical protein
MQVHIQLSQIQVKFIDLTQGEFFTIFKTAEPRPVLVKLPLSQALVLSRGATGYHNYETVAVEGSSEVVRLVQTSPAIFANQPRA